MVNNTVSEMYSLKYGVPQGSCAGPVAFLGYLSSMYDIVDKHLPMIGGYADDHQLYLAFNPGSQQNEMDAIQCLEACIADIRTWMFTHQLKINDSKTEFLLFGTKQQLEKVNISEIKVGSDVIKPVQSTHNLGVMFDSSLSMRDHVNQVCKKGYHQLTKVWQIKKYMDKPALASVVHSFVTSGMDYCNAVLFGCPTNVIDKLQKLQNCAARVVVGVCKFDHITPVLQELH